MPASITNPIILDPNNPDHQDLLRVLSTLDSYTQYPNTKSIVQTVICQSETLFNLYRDICKAGGGLDRFAIANQPGMGGTYFYLNKTLTFSIDSNGVNLWNGLNKYNGSHLAYLLGHEGAHAKYNYSSSFSSLLPSNLLANITLQAKDLPLLASGLTAMGMVQVIANSAEDKLNTGTGALSLTEQTLALLRVG